MTYMHENIISGKKGTKRVGMLLATPANTYEGKQHRHQRHKHTPTASAYHSSRLPS